MGLQYTTPPSYTAESLGDASWSDENISTTSFYDECLWKELTFGVGVDWEYMDDIDEISPSLP